MIDTKVEKIKTRDEILTKEKFISSLQNNLKNPAFIKKAPPKIIEMQKNRLDDEIQQLKKLKEHFQNL